MSDRLKARALRRAAPARQFRIRLTAAIAALALVTGASIASSSVNAYAADDDYPTLAEVQKAKKNVSDTAAIIKRIEASLEKLEAKVTSTAAAAEKAGTEAQVADQNYQEQSLKTIEIQGQADTAETDAASAKTQAGEMAARLYRSGGQDFSVNLFLDASNADDLLYNVGMSGKLTEQAQNLYTTATEKKNTAQSLSDQASVAADLLEELKIEMDAKAAVAVNLANEAQTALDEEAAHKAEMDELLVTAKATAETTAADYEKGVAKRKRAEAKRLRELAKNNGIGVYQSEAPQIVGEWARPAWGRITSNFGYRINPFGGGGTVFHMGTDIGAACGTPIYAAHAGKVSYSGWSGVYGNFIRVDIGDGVQTEYGHIINGGLKVRNGESVEAGQTIAYVGQTGGATGCHLHYNVRINGLVTDPVPFMRANGITLG